MELYEVRSDEIPPSPQPRAPKQILETGTAPEQNGIITLVDNGQLSAPKISTARVAMLLGTIWVSHSLLFSSLLFSSLLLANILVSDDARLPTPR